MPQLCPQDHFPLAMGPRFLSSLATVRGCFFPFRAEKTLRRCPLTIHQALGVRLGTFSFPCWLRGHFRSTLREDEPAGPSPLPPQATSPLCECDQSRCGGMPPMSDVSSVCVCGGGRYMCPGMPPVSVSEPAPCPVPRWLVGRWLAEEEGSDVSRLRHGQVGWVALVGSQRA